MQKWLKSHYLRRQNKVHVCLALCYPSLYMLARSPLHLILTSHHSLQSLTRGFPVGESELEAVKSQSGGTVGQLQRTFEL